MLKYERVIKSDNILSKEVKFIMELDNLHYTTNEIDGHQKDLNFIVSTREDGKTTTLLNKFKRKFIKTGRPTILIRRLQADITDAYITSLEKVMNKFKGDTEKAIHLTYKKGTIKEGIVELYNGDKLMFVVIALATPLQRTKSLFIENPAYFFFEEFIVDTRKGEKYLKGEVERFKEIYTTFYREGETAPKVYFAGNPYSMYNPYFVAYGIDAKELIKKGIVTKGNVAVQYHRLSAGLLEKIREKNSLFKETDDDRYLRYALLGEAVNDDNINILPKLPPNFSLSLVIYKEGRYLGIFKNNDIFNFDLKYYVGHCDKVSARRAVFSFDFSDLVDDTILFDREERAKFSRFKCAFRKKAVAFESLECNYFIEEIYSNL